MFGLLALLLGAPLCLFSALTLLFGLLVLLLSAPLCLFSAPTLLFGLLALLFSALPFLLNPLISLLQRGRNPMARRIVTA